MPRRLLVLNVALGLVSLFFAVGIVRALLVKHPLPKPTVLRAVAPTPPVAPATASDAKAEAYAAIAAQNLFNPGRNEMGSSTAATASVVKPILHGIVIEGGKSRAFLEDPSIRRVGGYSIGDSVGGGQIQKIADDRVVIARPEGIVEVLLQDPSKPRPVAPGPAGPAVTVPGQPVPGQPVPGQPVPGQAVPGQVPVPAAPLVQAPPSGPVQVAPPPAPGAPPAQQPAIPTQNRRRAPSQSND
jgi:hypothetical protein